jgi:hypothetical protein
MQPSRSCGLIAEVKPDMKAASTRQSGALATRGCSSPLPAIAEQSRMTHMARARTPAPQSSDADHPRDVADRLQGDGRQGRQSALMTRRSVKDVPGL